MVALQIRDVPQDTRDALAELARARGQSLQAFLLSLVQQEARRARNTSLLERFAARTDGSRVEPDDAAAELIRARAERDDRLATGTDPAPHRSR